jgi:hypothetical protein
MYNMTTLLEIPLREISAAALMDLQAKYPDATLRVEAENAVHKGPMDETQFWAIIALIDWDKSERDDILRPAVEALSHFSKADICAFYDLLNQKLYDLDGQRFAEQLGSNRYAPDNHFSVDDFLYTRCGVVANGRAFFEEVLQRPERIPKEFTFEPLLSLPDEAWQLKTGRDDLDYFPEVWYETFSNPDGWPGIKTIKERLLRP